MGTLQLTLAMLSTVNLGACSADAYEEKLQKQMHNPPSLFHDKEAWSLLPGPMMAPPIVHLYECC